MSLKSYIKFIIKAFNQLALIAKIQVSSPYYKTNFDLKTNKIRNKLDID